MKAPRPALSIGMALFAFVASVPVVASDGVLEIHQACVAAGCFDGDTAGWPVTLASSGSYRLASNLVLPDENTTGVEITAFGVTLDLGGFAISGPTSCSWDDSGGPPTVVCTPSGTGMGVHATERATVRNGWIRGVGGDGVYLELGGEVSAVNIREVGERGIHGDNVQFFLCQGNHVELTGDDGIRIQGLASGNVLKFVGDGGILATNIEFNDVVFAVGDALIVGGPWGNVAGNTVYASNGYCVWAQGKTAAIRDNVLRSCGGVLCTDASSSQTAGCTVTGNTMALSGPLYLSATSGYGHNTLYENNGGNSEPQVVGGHEIGTNVCGTDTTCP